VNLSLRPVLLGLAADGFFRSRSFFASEQTGVLGGRGESGRISSSTSAGGRRPHGPGRKRSPACRTAASGRPNIWWAAEEKISFFSPGLPFISVLITTDRAAGDPGRQRLRADHERHQLAQKKLLDDLLVLARNTPA